MTHFMKFRGNNRLYLRMLLTLSLPPKRSHLFSRFAFYAIRMKEELEKTWFAAPRFAEGAGFEESPESLSLFTETL